MKAIFAIVKTLLVALMGLITTALAIVLVVWVELKFNLAIYSYTLWFVIPIGAIVCGLASASGYVSSRPLNYRPTRLLLGMMLLVSASEWFLINWVEYAQIKVDDIPLSRLLSFGDYLSFMLSHYTMKTGIGFRGHAFVSQDVTEVGSSGYFFGFIQIVGFVLASLMIYRYLHGQAYCDRCARYMTEKGKQTRYFKDRSQLRASVNSIIDLIRTDNLQGAILAHALQGPSYDVDERLSTTVEVRCCERCEKHWLQISAQEKSGSEWKNNGDFTHHAYTDEPLTLEEN